MLLSQRLEGGGSSFETQNGCQLVFSAKEKSVGTYTQDRGTTR